MISQMSPMDWVVLMMYFLFIFFMLIMYFFFLNLIKFKKNLDSDFENEFKFKMIWY